MVDAPVLREAALFYAECNLPEISQQDGFQDTMAGSLDIAQVRLATGTTTYLGSNHIGTTNDRGTPPRCSWSTGLGGPWFLHSSLHYMVVNIVESDQGLLLRSTISDDIDGIRNLPRHLTLAKSMYLSDCSSLPLCLVPGE